MEKILSTIFYYIINSDIILIFRIFVAGLCGFLIGYERKNRAKGAGIRTHFVVAAASALMMIISIYGFEGSHDPSRMAAQIVSGIGFLGAGMIFVHKQTISGLTTAAGIWATSGIGMAIGTGMYTVGIATTFIIIFAQIFMHSHFTWLQPAVEKNFFVYSVTENNFRETATKTLEKHGITVSKINVDHHADTKSRDYMFTLEVPPKIHEEELIDLFDKYSCKIKEKH